MEAGNIVEFIDNHKILCAVVLEVKNQRFRLLTETNREVSLSKNRVLHKSAICFDITMGRSKMLEALKEIKNKRNDLVKHIDIKELWEVLNTEQEWIDLATMTEFCFFDNPDYDHESAVIRSHFINKRFFKFKNNRFFPNSEEQVQQKFEQEKAAEKRNKIIKNGCDWLKRVLYDNNHSFSEDDLEFVEILKSFYILEKESEYYNVCNEMIAITGIHSSAEIFHILVNLGVFDENENIDLYRYDIPTAFSKELTENAADRGAGLRSSSQAFEAYKNRKDLTMLDIITIDGQATLDYDDALSIEDKGDHYLLGIHIVDVGHFIKRGDIIDKEAMTRGCSIYMPDKKISMLPPCLSEDTCSLKAGEPRPAISVMIKTNKFFDLIDYDIFASLIIVKKQLTYYDVNLNADKNKSILILRQMAENFRQYRMSQGAVNITLPEINVIINGNGEIIVNSINRESPGRMLVSEMMIMANWVMAGFLSKHGAPAIYRSQPHPRKRLLKDIEGTLFENCMQRRQLSRFILDKKPEHHSGLGLDAYVTSTSPIRKYFDLATQRQIRALLGLEDALYTPEETDEIIRMLDFPMKNASRIQYRRKRYWLYKYLEKKIGNKEEAVVLYKRKNSYQILLANYMIECDLHGSSGIEIKPGDLIQVTIQHVDARKDVFSVFMG